MAEVRVVAHQVPEDRPVADVHQRLRNGVRSAPAGGYRARRKTDTTFTVLASFGLRVSRAPSVGRTAAIRPASQAPQAAVEDARKRIPERSARYRAAIRRRRPGSTPTASHVRARRRVPADRAVESRLPSRGSPFGLQIHDTPIRFEDARRTACRPRGSARGIPGLIRTDRPRSCGIRGSHRSTDRVRRPIGRSNPGEHSCRSS